MISLKNNCLTWEKVICFCNPVTEKLKRVEVGNKEKSIISFLFISGRGIKLQKRQDEQINVCKAH